MPSLTYSVLCTQSYILSLTYYSLYKDLMSKVCLGEIYIYIQGPKTRIRVDVHDRNICCEEPRMRSDEESATWGLQRPTRKSGVEPAGDPFSCHLLKSHFFPLFSTYRWMCGFGGGGCREDFRPHGGNIVQNTRERGCAQVHTLLY